MDRVDDATTVRPLGANRYAATLHEGWDGGPGVPLGGYTVAVAARALGHALGRDPLSVSTHFLRPAQFGPAEITTTCFREGSSQSVGQAVLTQEGTPVAVLVGTYGGYGPPSDDGYAAPAPVLPAPEECIDPRPAIAPLQDRIEVLAPVGSDRWHRGEPFDEPASAAWLSFRDGAPMDAYALLVLADYGPPLPWLIGRWGAVPTIELTVQIRRAPVTGRVRLATRMPWLDGSFVSDQMQWNEAGEVVLTARQLGRLIPA